GGDHRCPRRRASFPPVAGRPRRPRGRMERGGGGGRASRGRPGSDDPAGRDGGRGRRRPALWPSFGAGGSPGLTLHVPSVRWPARTVIATERGQGYSGKGTKGASVIEEGMAGGYARRVGERLRAIRKQKGLSLQEVEGASAQEFKASVLGAYERG